MIRILKTIYQMNKEIKCTMASCKGDCKIAPRRVPIDGEKDWEIEVCDEKGLQTWARKNEYTLPPVKIIKVNFKKFKDYGKE